jgi:hypothetical protein
MNETTTTTTTGGGSMQVVFFCLRGGIRICVGSSTEATTSLLIEIEDIARKEKVIHSNMEATCFVIFTTISKTTISINMFKCYYGD